LRRVAPQTKPEDVGLSSERLARIHAAMERYISHGDVAGSVALVSRRGKVAYLDVQGNMDIEGKKPMRADSMFRIASMTKPIASIAAMMLYEQGYFQLNDPVSKFIPEFKNPKVAVASAPAPYKVIPADREITIRHLLTHTAGLPNTYVGFMVSDFNKLSAERKPSDTVCDMTRKLAKMPLEFEPGTQWAYGPATDVLGCLVEIISGMTLEQYFQQKIFTPLGMTDTYFNMPEDKLARLSTIYRPAAPNGILPVAMTVPRTTRYFSGAGGLISTAGDYARFCQMLLDGGTLDGTRLVSRKTIELMTKNHIGDAKLWASLPGRRFGLGFSVVTDLGESANLGSAGSYGWGGAFGTYFWVDPKEKSFAILMIQIRPYDHLNIRQDFQTLVNQAIID
jgi:CubicO group peptidase (beta-lactamase class C family)